MKLSDLKPLSLCPRCISTQFVDVMESGELVCMNCTAAMTFLGKPFFWTWHMTPDGQAAITTWVLR